MINFLPLLKLQRPQTCWRLEVGLLLLLDGLGVVVCRAFMHGERGDLLVGFAAVVAVVWFAGRVDDMVFIKAGVFCEALLTPWHGANVGLLSCREQMTQKKNIKTTLKKKNPCRHVSELSVESELTCVNPHMVLVISGAGERASAGGLGAVVRPLSSVCSDMNFADVGRGERPAAAFHRALKGLLSCNQRRKTKPPLHKKDRRMKP